MFALGLAFATFSEEALHRGTQRNRVDRAVTRVISCMQHGRLLGEARKRRPCILLSSQIQIRYGEAGAVCGPRPALCPRGRRSSSVRRPRKPPASLPTCPAAMMNT